jgi:hypothetical protein
MSRTRAIPRFANIDNMVLSCPTNMSIDTLIRGDDAVLIRIDLHGEMRGASRR